jgi:hypothetical protein
MEEEVTELVLSSAPFMLVRIQMAWICSNVIAAYFGCFPSNCKWRGSARSRCWEKQCKYLSNASVH